MGVDPRSGRGQRALPALGADLAAIVAIAVCALVLHRNGLFGGSAFYERDTQIFYYPLARWVSQQLHQAIYPLWLPQIFTGYPLYADGELGLLYLPQVLLLWLLPAASAMVWLRTLHAFLAGLFMYLLLRTWRLGPLAGVGGALVFAFGSFLIAQMHHENVVRSAVWLPAVLACAQRAATAERRSSSIGWAALGALTLAQSALGLHVQPVLMLLIALGGFGLFLAATQWRRWQAPIASVIGIGAGGLLIAAAQWLPLGEWALVSSRRGGVDYEFGSAFALSPENLPTLLFPFFFRLPDASVWWTLWQQWETELYVGIATLALILVGLVFARRAEVVYLAILGALSLWVAMANYAPLLNLHVLLWSVPGFSFLRAPGRFSYLVVFACAGLAAFGLEALLARRDRLRIALVGAVPALVTLVALLALLPTWRGWLLADPQRALAFVQSTYLATRSQYPIDPSLVVQGLDYSLDLADPKTAWSLGLLALTALAFGVWFVLGQRRALLGQAVFVGLIAADLLVFAADFHPSAPLDSFVPSVPAGVPAGARVLVHDSGDLPAIEPDQLVAADIGTVDGYSSLPSQRHVEVEAETSTQPALFDLWSAGYISEPLAPSDLHTVDGVRFRAQHPLAAGFGGSLPTVLHPPSAAPTTTIRLIGTLSYAFRAPQGAQIATLAVTDGAGHTVTLPIRAGIELSERAFDRPSLRGLVQHQKAHVALDFEEATPAGEDYTAHLYEADLPLPGPMAVQSITLAPRDPQILVELQGLALVDAAGQATSLDLSNRAGLQTVSPGVLADTTALPRAFVLPQDQAFSPGRHPDLTATQLVANPDMDLHRQVLIEGDPSVGTQPRPDGVPARAADRLEDLGPNAVRITATADVPSYLVLDDFYHRGWSATVDGQSTHVLIANALFRAVALPPGQHTVEFHFQPLSHTVGALITAAALLAALALLAHAALAARGAQR